MTETNMVVGNVFTVTGLIFANIPLSYFTGNYYPKSWLLTYGIYNLDIFGAYGNAINKGCYY